MFVESNDHGSAHFMPLSYTGDALLPISSLLFSKAPAIPSPATVAKPNTSRRVF
jgi:hypothetical protein